MTEQKQDRDTDMTGSDTGTGSDVGPDAERDQSGLGSQQPSGQAGWQGSETSEAEPSSVGQAVTGSMGAGGGAGSMAGQMESGWQGQTGGETGGAIGQEGVAGGESWEGRSRDIGTSGWTTGDAGFGSETRDDGGPNTDASAGTGERGGSGGSGEQAERS